MPPLQTNAALTAVHTPGSAPDWTKPGNAGDEKWTGTERVYYRETRDRVAAGDATTVVLQRTVIVALDDGALEHIDSNDVLTIEPDDGDTLTAVAKVIPRVRLAGLSSALQTSRIELEPAPAPDVE